MLRTFCSAFFSGSLKQHSEADENDFHSTERLARETEKVLDDDVMLAQLSSEDCARRFHGCHAAMFKKLFLERLKIFVVFSHTAHMGLKII
jgi:hypothetical protein